MTPPSPSPSPLTDFSWWAKPPTPSPAPAPTPIPIPSPTIIIGTNTPAAVSQQQSSSPPPPRLPVDFSPPLIAMVVVVAAAFLIVTYSRLISRHLIPPLLRLLRRRRRRRPSSAGGGDLDSLPYYDSPFDASDGFHVISPYGLDDSVIKTIPLSIYTTKRNSINNNHYNTKILSRDCAVCLIEFDEDDYVRTLPVCSHAFHVDCIDMWLRSHANCPLCRAAIFGRPPESPFVPLMAARIRPSLDDAALRSIALEHQAAAEFAAAAAAEITPCVEEVGLSPEERGFSAPGRDFLLKRSYSFGFERSAASERMMMMATEPPATASPWRYHGRRVGGFWSKRPSPFGSLTKPRVFSFRYYRGMKSPFFRRSRGFFPMSESSSRFSGGGGSSRRTKSITSPMFMPRPSAAAPATAFSSSRLRCGDPEALLSPERFNRR